MFGGLLQSHSHRPFLAAALLLAAPAAASEDATYFKIEVGHDGLYAVTFEDLVDAGLSPNTTIATERLGLRGRGDRVPLHIDDGDDGRFDPGDRLVFVGSHPRGEHSHRDPHSRFNAYFLDLTSDEPARFAEAPSTDCREPVLLLGQLRLENDAVRARFPSASQETTELWYWTRVSSAEDPFEIELPPLDAAPSGTVELRIHLRGWSWLGRGHEGSDSDHRVEVLLNETPLGIAEWDNEPAGKLLEFELDVSRFSGGTSRLVVSVPQRSGRDGAPLVDAVLLNWIDIRYPLASPPERGQFGLDTSQGSCLVGLHGAAYSATGHRFSGRVGGGGGWRVRSDGVPGRSDFGPLFVGDPVAPRRIERRHPAGLRGAHQGADYLMVVHPRLRAALEPLAEYHRSEGLRVAVVNVDDIYDEFNHGLVSPSAIRDFVAHAASSWEAPPPRFLLLAGDASWDTFNPEPVDARYADWTFRGQPGFVKNASVSYEGPALLGRGLVPTWTSPTYEGDAASDNYFAAVVGDDDLPDLAVGRLPAATPEELGVMVDKTLGQHRAAPGPWRREVLWLTNEQRRYQRQSDTLAAAMEHRGLASTRIYPSPEEPSNAAHQESIRLAFDEGYGMVHFVGHGGRYIWRTGPPSIEKNHDLFTLDDLDRLSPNERLPLVLSMSCYTAPFDHPSADSIGEKLLRLEGRGSAAVIAASWRNTPNMNIDRTLVEEVAAGGTVGEALLRAKRRLKNRGFIEQYNLLGDPALPIPLPTETLQLELANGDISTVEIGIEPTRLPAQLLVEWLDGDEVVDSFRGEATEPETLIVPGAESGAPQRALRVRAYAWSTASGFQATGAVELPAAEGLAEEASTPE